MNNEIEALTFIGKAFPDAMMDSNASFGGCNQSVEEDEAFQKFVKDHDLGENRANLIVFGPEHFMYWYGVAIPEEVDQVPGLLKFSLPKAKVFQKEESASAVAFELPLNFELPKFMNEAGELGDKFQTSMVENLTPYILRQLDLANKKLTKTMYLEISSEK